MKIKEKLQLAALGLNNKIVYGTALVCTALAHAEGEATTPADPTAQLDALNTTLTTISTKASTISNGIIGICTIGVVMVIVIGWLKKGKKAV